MNEARTRERPASSGPREHEIGERGVVTVATTLDGIVVRGVDGASARLVGPDATDVFTEAVAGRFSVRTADAPDWPATGSSRNWLGTVLSFGFTRAGRTIELEVPHGCRVEASSASGSVTIAETGGGIAVNTASGAVRAQQVAGDARIRTASGDVSVTSPDRLTATIRTASGDVEVDARCIAGLDLSTVSGRVDVTGAIEPAVDGRISTASGKVALGLSGGVTVAIRTVSGKARASHPDAAPGEKGPGWVIGDGTARVSVSTISGAIHLRQPGAEQPTQTVTEEPSGAAGAGPAAADAMPAAAEEALPPVPDEATLDVLRALERGEIDVDEAARRLDPGAQGNYSDA
jgi:hypothetical protein